MNNKRISQTLLGMLLLVSVSAVNAIPTLSFGGDLSYTASSGSLALNGKLIGSESILPLPDLTTSTISLISTLTTSMSLSGVTVGLFGAGTISVSDVSGGLLTGSFSALQLAGLDGGDQGSIGLQFTPTGGSLLSYFSDPSDLRALTFNLSTGFGSTMFYTDFRAASNGNITSATVPEPNAVMLLVVGLCLLGISSCFRRVSCAIRSRHG